MNALVTDEAEDGGGGGAGEAGGEIPDIDGLEQREDGSLWFNGERVKSITGLDGEKEGKEVYKDGGGGGGDSPDEAEVAGDDDMDVGKMEAATGLKGIKNMEEVKSLDEVKSIQEVSKISPVKSIQEIKNIQEVKRIHEIPEDIARAFIKKHGLGASGAGEDGGANEADIPDESGGPQRYPTDEYDDAEKEEVFEAVVEFYEKLADILGPPKNSGSGPVGTGTWVPPVVRKASCRKRCFFRILSEGGALGMGKGPKRTFGLVNYRLEVRPLTDPRPRILGLDLDLTQNRLDQATSCNI